MNYRSYYNDDLTEDYPTAWNKDEFEGTRSFAGKLRYAATHLPKIASGSGRAVFKVDDHKVIKIAKNKKGLAQNSVESERYIQNYGVVAQTFDSGDAIRDEGPFWVEMELAKKLTPTRFKQITGVDVKELGDYLQYISSQHHGERRSSFNTPSVSPEVKQKMENNEFVTDLVRLLLDYDMETGDNGRLSTYGEVLRDGKPTVVMVDFGLTRSVFNDYYRVG